MGKKFSEFEAFFFDSDGVLRMLGTPIDGARETVRFLRAEGKKVCVVSNNATRNRKVFAELLKELGFDFSENEIVTSAYATARYLKENQPGKKVLLFLNDNVKEEFLAEGVELVDYEHWEDAEIVVAGLNREITYDKLKWAMSAIMNGAKFIATNTDPILNAGPKKWIPGAGSIVSALSTATGKKPEIIVGKPNPLIMKMALEQMEVSAKDTAMFGDRLDTDVEAANAAGVYSVVVLTGDTPQDIQPKDLPEKIRPKSTIFSLKDVSARW